MHTRMYVRVMCVCVICLYCNILDIHKAQRQKAVIPRLDLFCAASNPHLCRSLGPPCTYTFLTLLFIALQYIKLHCIIFHRITYITMDQTT